MLVQLQRELRLWFTAPHPFKLDSGAAGGALGQIFHPTQQSGSCLPLLPRFWLLLHAVGENGAKAAVTVPAALTEFPAQLRVFQLLDFCV